MLRLRGTTDFYHFISHSVTLTLAVSRKFSRMQKPLASLFCKLSLNGMNFGGLLKQFKRNILILLLSEFVEVSEITAVFTDCVK